MGALTSKHVDEIVGDVKSQSTPKVKKIPFDPRSPSDDITRTPITMLTTPESNAESTPTDAKVIKVVDPRSPNNEVMRTPIIVEKKEAPHRPLHLKPNMLMKLDSLSSSNEENNDNEEQDPRSPTTKVPRTPLEDRTQELELEESHCGQKQSSDAMNQNALVTEKQELSNTLVKKLFTSDSPVDKVRQPLSSVQNTNVGKTPRGLLQAKHCKNIEDEYNKNHQTIVTQLSNQENTVSSNTEFVENI